MPRVFDCFIYEGQAEALEIRLRELWDVVDCFVLIEREARVEGEAPSSHWNPRAPRFTSFAAKVRHVVSGAPEERAASETGLDWKDAAILRGTPDAGADDILLLCDVEEIPSAAAVRSLLSQEDGSLWGLELALHASFLDRRQVRGPHAGAARSIAARRSLLDRQSPTALRQTVQAGESDAAILSDAGWCFLHLIGSEKPGWASDGFIEASYPELGRPCNSAPLKSGQARWARVGREHLPSCLEEERERFAPFFAPPGLLERIKGFFGPAKLPPRAAPAILQPRPAPMVICPYLYEEEEAEVRRKFDLDGPGGEGLPFYLWHDAGRVGPERAFEHCWSLFPEQDIIIVHSDMAPMPGQTTRAWYEDLCAYRERLPDAGMIACDLVYPHEPGETPKLQSAGGGFGGGRIEQIYDFAIDDAPRGLDMSEAREVDWVTFGGVLILRETIRACGGFDWRYQWAYYMDVDYCLQARLHGFKLYQAPVNLVHEESRTTRGLLREDRSLEQHIHANKAKLFEKWERFDPLLPSRYFGPVVQEQKHPEDAAS